MQSERVTSGGVGLQVWVDGPDDAPPLLLLHGWPETHLCWEAVAPRLSDRFRLLMPDLRGFGNSDMPEGTDAYSLRVVTADVLAILHHFGVTRAGVVGHDFGGVVAWTLGTFAPASVSGMVIMCSPHPLRMREAAIADPSQWSRSFYAWLMHAGPEGEALLASDDFRTLAHWAFRGSQVPDETIARYRESWAEPGRFHAMAEWYRTNFRPSLFNPDAPAPKLPPVTVPTRYLHGEMDQAFVPSAGHGSGDYVSAEYREEVVPGAGHWLPHDQPDLVATAIAEWLGTRSE
jgi:pimeloyl-ACP methyl ester carboxylesterase